MWLKWKSFWPLAEAYGVREDKLVFNLSLARGGQLLGIIFEAVLEDADWFWLGGGRYDDLCGMFH